MPPIRIHLIRHGQGLHQLPPTDKNQYLPDPALTEEGIAACKTFRQTYPASALNPDIICASPLRRTIQTAKYCFADRFDSDGNGGEGGMRERILLIPYAQEATDLPSDTGSERAVLEGEFGGLVDCGLLVGEDGEDGEEEGGWRSSSGVYAPTHEALRARAKGMRAWLAGRSEGEVVVVGHGQFWHWLTGEVDEEGRQTTPFWGNAELRSYTLEIAAGEDGEVSLVEEKESLERRGLPN